MSLRACRVAAWQFQPVAGDVKANLASLRAALDEPVARGVDVFLAPEMCLTGWHPRRREWASAPDGPLVGQVGELATEFGVHLATSLLTARAGRYYNTFMLWSPDGTVLGQGDKIHLWDREKETVSPGGTPVPIETGVGPVGGVICYDVEFPEVSRALAVAGAQLLLVPAAFYSPQSWDLMTRTRALENGCYLVAANQIGGDPKHPHNGQSRIVDPYGTVVAEIKKEAGVIVAELDPTKIRKAREWAPFLRDRRVQFA